MVQATLHLGHQDTDVCGFNGLTSLCDVVSSRYVDALSILQPFDCAATRLSLLFGSPTRFRSPRLNFKKLGKGLRFALSNVTASHTAVMRRALQHGRSKSSQTAPPAAPEDVPEIVIEAGRVAEIELDRECILERSRLVSVAPARMPFIGFHGKYNKRWYSDIVALPHNSIRTFISEVFALLIAIHRLALDMTDEDFRKVFFFIGEFAKFVQVILEAEETILYPEVDGSLKKKKDFATHALNPKNRAQRKKSIFELLSGLTDEDLPNKPSVTIVGTLQKTVDDLSRQLLDYFSIQESELPRYFAKSLRGQKEKNRMEGRLIKHFAEKKQEYYYTALLTLPLQTEEVRAEFEERHFSKANRAKFRNAIKNVTHSLKGIPRAFEGAAQKYEARFSMAAFLENYGKDRDVEATTQVL